MSAEDWPEADQPRKLSSRAIDLELADRDSLERRKISREEIFATHCRMYRLPPYTREYEFAKALKRKWRLDFLFTVKARAPAGMTLPDYRLGVEIEGIVMRRSRQGEWVMGGKHGTIQGFKEDCIKYSTAELLGIHVIRFEQSQIDSKFAIQQVMRILQRHGWRPDDVRR